MIKISFFIVPEIVWEGRYSFVLHIFLGGFGGRSTFLLKFNWVQPRSPPSKSHGHKITNLLLPIYREHNEKKSTYTMGMNMWTDLTDEEWSNQFLGYKRVSTLHPAVHKESRLFNVKLSQFLGYKHLSTLHPAVHKEFR